MDYLYILGKNIRAYRLKEGISLIDDKAFISIIDNYETINKNRRLNKKLKIDK